MTTKSTQSSKQETGVPSWLDGYYKELMGKTSSAVGAVDRTPYSGTVIAGANGFDQKGLDAGRTAANLMSPINGLFTRNAMDVASGRYLDPDTNPALRSNISAATAPVMEQLQRQILPGLKQNDISMNAFGSDRGLLREGQAVGDYGEAAARISAEMIGDNYNRERSYQVQAPQMYQDAASAEMLPTQIFEALATMQRGDQQLGIDNDLMLRQLNAMLPFLGLSEAASIYGSAPYRTSSGTTTQTQTADPLTEIAKMGLGGMSMLSGMGVLGAPMGAGAVPAGNNWANPLSAIFGGSANRP